MGNYEFFYKEASRINDQTTERSVIVITNIFIIITKLTEITVNYTKLALMLGLLVVLWGGVMCVCY